jgi:hypothetical protein
MTTPRNALRPLLHRLGATGPSRVRTSKGSSTSAIKATTGVHQGPPTAAITFTRNNNCVSRHENAGKQERKGNHLAKLRSLIPTILVSLLALCLAPSVASASFTRPFERQIFRSEEPIAIPCTEAEAKAASSPCFSPNGPGGVAVNSADDLLVGNLNDDLLDEFEPAAASNKPIPLTPEFKTNVSPGDLAVETATSGDIYVTEPSGTSSIEVYSSAGHLEQTWTGFDAPQIAIDNSPKVDSARDESSCETGLLSLDECYVYVATRSESGGIEKFNSKGEAQPFSCTAAECDYVGEGENEGKKTGVRNKITGTPGEPTTNREGYEGETVAVDPSGDIYAAGVNEPHVHEYAPSGKYLKTISLQSPEVPTGWDEGRVGSIHGIAVDPVSGHLLVSLGSGGVGQVGAIDEFDVETGKYVAQLTQTGEGAPLHGPGAIAVDSLGDLYVADQEAHAVDVWGPGAYYPTIALTAASERTGTSAVLNGSLNPEQASNEHKAPLTACYFQYTEEAVYVQALANKEEGGFPKANVKVTEAPCVPDAAELQKAVEKEEKTYPVHAGVGALTAGVAYRYRLVATTQEGSVTKGGTAHSEALAFTAPHAPRIESASAANLSSTFADLHAQIDPLGANTSYHFEYLTAAAFTADGESFSGADPATSVPVPDEPLGAGGPTGSALESVEQHVGGLAPDTSYHFRVVAVNECEAGRQCVTEGADDTFTTLPAALSGPPDNRAYELVTPADKQGGSDLFALPETDGESANRDVGAPAQSGEGFALETLSPFGSFPFAVSDQDLFARNVSRGGWEPTSLALPSLGVQTGLQPAIFDPVDLSRVAFTDGVGSETGEEGDRSVDLVGPVGAQEPCNGAVSLLQAVSTGCDIELHHDPPIRSSEPGANLAALASTTVAGASRDLSHVVLESEIANVCPGSEGVNHGHLLCEWSGGYEQGTLADGEPGPVPTLTLVNEKQGKPVSECGAVIGGYGDPDGAAAGSAYRAVSAEGSRVFFTAPDPRATEAGLNAGKEGKEGCWNPEQERLEGKPPKNAPQLYMRANGETTEISAPEEGVTVPTDGDYPATYVGASADGSRVFFATKTELTADDHGIHDLELYEYDTETATLTRISAGESGHEAAEVVTVYAVAAQGTAVYFTADGVLAGNEGPDGSHASPGGCHLAGSTGPCNLYRYQPVTATRAAKISFVARVNEHDVSHTGSGTGIVPRGEDLRAYATPDGRYLLFDTREDLTGYSTAGCVAYSQQCMELYRYDAQAAEAGEPAVVCVSCDPSGAAPVSNAKFARSAQETPSAGPVRAMSDNGQYVFFDSRDALVSGASNGQLDVYEWHEDPLTQRSAVSLLGSGTDAGPSFFLGYAPNEYTNSHGEQVKVEAGNVFIGTHAQLSPQDTNSVGDIYDARACEPQSPCIQPPIEETAQCLAGECQKPPPLPLFQTPATNTLTSSGNTATAPPPAVKKKTAAQLRAEKLAKALETCRKEKSKAKRKTCEAAAQKKYGATKAKKKAKKSNHGRAKS